MDEDATTPNHSFILKMEVAGFSETYVPIYQTTRQHMPEYYNL
jgi:hypothetical protein